MLAGTRVSMWAWHAQIHTSRAGTNKAHTAGNEGRPRLSSMTPKERTVALRTRACVARGKENLKQQLPARATLMTIDILLAVCGIALAGHKGIAVTIAAGCLNI